MTDNTNLITRETLVRDEMRKLRLEERVDVLLKSGHGVQGTVAYSDYANVLNLSTAWKYGKGQRWIMLHADDIVAIERIVEAP